MRAERRGVGEIVDALIAIGLGVLVTGDQYHRGQARAVRPPPGARSGCGDWAGTSHP